MLDVSTLIHRAAASPEVHLGRKSLQLLHSYLTGYDIACAAFELPCPHDDLDFTHFQRWLQQRLTMTEEHRSRMNAYSCLSGYSYAQLITCDDAEALEKFIEIRKMALDEFGKSPPQKCYVNKKQAARKLFDMLLDMRKLPAMYFGNHWTISDLWALMSGYLWCELDLGMEESENRRVLAGFQEWMDDRYPFASELTWDRTIHFLSLGSAVGSLDSFIEHFQMYLSGESATAMDPTMLKMFSAIKNKIDGEGEDSI